MKKLIYLICLLHSSASIAQSTPWQQVATQTTKDLNCIVFPTPLVGYIGGADSLLLKTTDGGITWNEVSYSGINFMPGGDIFLELDFISENIGFATVGPYTGVYRTNDGGLNWTPLTTSFCYNHGLYIFGDGNGFVGGSGCFQGEQMDMISLGTLTPVTINTPTWQPLDRIVDIDFDLNMFGSVGLAVSSGGRILRTSDSGLNWDTIPSSLGNSVPLTSVTIVHSNLAYVGYDNGGDGFGLLISTDGGLTWSLDPNTSTFIHPVFHDLHTTPLGRTYVGAAPSATTAGLIMESTASGVWNLYNVDEPIFSMTSYNDTVIWGAGKNGYLVRMTDPSTASVNALSIEETVDLFPNPASDFITIQFSGGSENSDFHIEVYSMEGRLVKKGEPGINTLHISELTGGNYLVKVNQDSRVASTKLVKL